MSLMAESPTRLQSELEACLSDRAEIYLPLSNGFANSDLRFTEYERPTYALAVRPGCAHDVVCIVKFAREKGIPFSPRAGHHCVTTTMRHLQNGLLIDMRSLNQISLNEETGYVTIGGGVITDEFVRFLESKGLEINVGSCPTTGVIGVSFGAGLGRLQGKYGFLHDNMISCKLVLADGSVTVVSRDSHADLFWAIRGAGHNFGIAVEATFQAYPQAYGGRHFTWDFEYNLEQCDSVFETLNRVHDSMPPELAIFILSSRQSKSGLKARHLILVNLVWSGKEAEADYWIQQFKTLEPVVTGIKTKTTWSELPWTTYNGLNKVLSKPEVWSRAPYKMMSAASVAKFDLNTTKAFFTSLKEMNETWAGKGVFGAMFESLPHHRSRELDAESTAFPWRFDTNHFLMMTATPFSIEDRDAFEAHLDKWKREFIAVSGYGRLHQYVNYGNTTSTMEDPPEALYGYEPWRLQKLRALKHEYDPDNVFRWYQPLV